MKFIYVLVLLCTLKVYSMDEPPLKPVHDHEGIYIKTNTDKHGSDSEITINIKKDDIDSALEKHKDRQTNLKIAKYAALSAISSAIITGIVGLIVGFEACKK